MVESKDPAIKLFGKKIALPDFRTLNVVSCDNSDGLLTRSCNSMPVDCSSDSNDSHVEEKEGFREAMESNGRQGSAEIEAPEEVHPTSAEPTKPEPVSEQDERYKTNNANEDETAAAKPSISDTSQTDTTHSQQKSLKKPDKILPCPRCNSMDTKFCYYNNYNVNQPRHFCRSCQRYWTAGGTMRNVPVGAGRRKNKVSTSLCRHVAMSVALQAAHVGVHHHQPLEGNGVLMSFGPDVPSDLETERNGTRNGFNKLFEQAIPVSCNVAGNGDDCSNGSSSVTTTNSSANGGKKCPQEPTAQDMNCSPSQVASIPQLPWAYPWSSGVPLPGTCPSGFPMPFFPPLFGNCCLPGPWVVPWLSLLCPPENQKAPGFCPSSSTLGKRSRDGDLVKSGSPERKDVTENKNTQDSILVSKTMRIDDLDEAARSSIWATLGIKNDSLGKGGLFDGFQQKIGKKENRAMLSPMLQANPAAMSRSLGFQEGAN